MQPSVAREVAVLKRMTVKEFRSRYLEVFGEEVRSGNKNFPWKRIVWCIQVLTEGDLSERARSEPRNWPTTRTCGIQSTLNDFAPLRSGGTLPSGGRPEGKAPSTTTGSSARAPRRLRWPSASDDFPWSATAHTRAHAEAQAADPIPSR